MLKEPYMYGIWLNLMALTFKTRSKEKTFNLANIMARHLP